MKKVLAMLVALLLVLSVLAGCGGSKTAAPAQGSAPAQQTQQVQPDKQQQAKQSKQDKQKQQQEKQNQAATQEAQQQQAKQATGTAAQVQVDKNGSYTDKDHVAAYIHQYNKLPGNYITKAQATKLGWKTKGTLDQVAPGKSIGGDHFGNFEGLLPKKAGRTYTECDIDYRKGNRGAKRIVFSNDGLIFYSPSHYKDFERLY